MLHFEVASAAAALLWSRPRHSFAIPRRCIFDL